MTNTETTTTNEAANDAQQGATVAPEKAPSKKGASHKKGAPTGSTGVQGDAPHATPFDQPKATKGRKGANPTQPATPFDQPKGDAPSAKRGKASANAKKVGKASVKKAAKHQPKTEVANAYGNKKEAVIALMKRPKGATIVEIRDITGWQKHTVRGFVSILGSKHGMKIESSKNVAGERVYKVAK